MNVDWFNRYNKQNPDSPLSPLLLTSKPSNIFGQSFLKKLIAICQKQKLKEKNNVYKKLKWIR